MGAEVGDAVSSRSRIPGIIIHHSASSIHSTPQEIDDWHRDRGFGGIGYHYAIHCPRGSSTWRTTAHRPEGSPGAHCLNRQTWIGIVVCGHYDLLELQAGAINELIQLCAEIRARLGVLPITGHRDHRVTRCPGDRLYSALSTIDSLLPL